MGGCPVGASMILFCLLASCAVCRTMCSGAPPAPIGEWSVPAVAAAWFGLADGTGVRGCLEVNLACVTTVLARATAVSGAHGAFVSSAGRFTRWS